MADKEKHGHDKHSRRSVRLKDYDYSQQGAYFVTICAKNRACLFGEIVDGAMCLNQSGESIQRIWYELPNRYTNLDLDAFILMPNHLHGIVVLTDNAAVGAPLAAPFPGRASPAPTLGGIVRTFKSISAMLLHRLLSRKGRPLWQRNYYEHIIRNEKSLNAIRDYILNNPNRWSDDPDNPETF